MKTIGLIGGMSWQSTIPYYRIINETVQARLGGLHSARCILWSFDFDEIERLQAAGDWEAATDRMTAAGRALAGAGAQLLAICTNTMHRMADEVEAAAGVPLVHIADATAAAVRATGCRRVGLLGTRFTMEQDFYRGRLARRGGLEVLVPDDAGRTAVHGIIYDELCAGLVREDSRRRFAAIIAQLAERGAEGVILGCTEIGLLVGPQDACLPLFDTTQIHARAVAEAALQGAWQD